MTVLDQLPEGSRVAIIRLRSLGDCVLTTPALQLLNETRPDLKIGIVVEDRFSSVFQDHPAVSTLLKPTWRAVRSWASSLCLNLHGGSRSQWMTALSGARLRAGFANHSLTFAYNLKIPRAQRVLGVNRVVHTAEHLASAVFALGVPLQEVPRASLFAASSPLKTRYAVMHPFASSPEKRWSPQRFCEVARYLQLWNVKPIFLAAAGDDTGAFEAHTIFRGTLQEAKSIISNAVLFLGNDSGPAHIAAAFGVPSIVVFSSSNPSVWAPWKTDSEVIVAADGMEHVSVSRVIAALERLLTLEEAHA